ncbi:MAG: OmpH family outer membrane protein [Bacteroidetes bacterium]|jgi:outer membrane protein|nr:OmpH family outer membrane protein [Bacteroidota bacterium]MDF2450521.1 OmpH family outer membrane protein [Bacteroidota bacterium]
MLKNTINVIAVVCLVTLGLFIYHTYFTTKVVYIDIPVVFNKFEMKKELQEKYKGVEAGRKRIIDSLGFSLQLLANKLKENKTNKGLMYEFDTRREEFFKRKNQMQEDNVALSTQYDKQILEQMTQYIIEYGKKNNYDVIMGADGTGTLMYANSKLDKSEEIIVFINKKYKGIE